MFCSRCGKKNNNDAKFCEFCGKSLPSNSIKEKLSPVETSKIINLMPTTRVRRFLNLIIDYVGIYIFGLILGFFLGITGLYYALGIESINEWILSILISLFYYIFFESIWSKTPAKFITKTRVVMENGKKPDFNSILIRTLIRCVPFEALTFLSPERPRGWHDRWSKTFVIDEE